MLNFTLSRIFIINFPSINVATISANPNSPVLIPDNIVRYIPVSIININFFQSFSLKSPNIIHKPNSKTIHKLFPDSKYPLYPISSKYVCDDVLVIIEKYNDTMYIATLINTDF